ncbi:helix-turn-helix domain-containing protein [Glycomyces sp. NPDC046736]|uniref:helix-turn-helix domain-containing protein n=1 Tax=Glycomyces sp. NPDC046736 TaxID=3155615 RepID=UPI00340D9FFD
MSPHRVTALVTAPQSTFELACAAEVFGTDRPALPSRYAFGVCTETPGLVPTLAGYAMAVSEGLEALSRADTIVVPGLQDRDRMPGPAVLEGLRAAHRRGARIAAICSGAFVLAEAGLLDGRRATTHWRMAEELRARYPSVEVEADPIFIDHGDVATSAGTSAGVDLCLHLVRRDLGAAYAAQVARHMVMPPHREGGQRQYAAAETAAAADSLGPLLEWAVEHLGEDLSVEALAERGRVSTRTLARRFADQLGMSPGRWLLAQRVAAARVLLEETDLSVEAVAARAGLSSAVNLRRRFRALVGTTPAAYRRSFGAR